MVRPAYARAHIALLALTAVLAACAGDSTGISSPSAVATTPAATDSTSKTSSTGTAKDTTTRTDTTTKPDTTTIVHAVPAASASILAGSLLWVDPNSNAKQTAAAWRTSRPADAIEMDKVASGATAIWIGNWNTNVQSDVDAATTQITASGAVPVFVAYNIPQRDCGGLSGGNATTISAYQTWVNAFANGIGSRRAAVVLEPDALAAMDCLNAADQQMRVSLLKYAVEAFAARGNVAVYIDAGHPGWQSASTMAARLTAAGIAEAQGFSLNVSNFIGTASNVSYGTQISALVSNKHFIVDTGRNGVGPTSDNQWCNPAGRALGNAPTTATGNPLVDAFLWIKTPGESDGACNGNPSAGAWMPEYALGLAQLAAY